MENKKRQRINVAEQLEKRTTVEQATSVVEETPKSKVDAEPDYILPNGEFDWIGYEAESSTKLRANYKINTTSRKHTVFSHDANAQEFYNMLNDSNLESTMTVSQLVENDVMEGRIHTMSERWATVDVNYREMLYIDLSKEDEVMIKEYRAGDTVNVKVISDKTASREFALASITEGTKQKVFLELRESAEAGDTAFMGHVASMIPGGGYIVKVQGIECFMPGSLAGINKLADFESIVGTDMYVVPDSFSERRGTIVVSHRAYLQAMIPGMIAEVEEDLDAVQAGKVTGTTKFGVFCEFKGCLTGMIHINDLDVDWAAKHRSGEINPGDDIDFKVKEVVNTKKIILTQVEARPEEVDNSWEEFTKDIKLPILVDGTVRSVKDYGVFIQVHGTVVGMAHSSSFVKGTNLKETFARGQEVSVEVTKIDNDTKKVFLKVVGA